MNTRLDMDKIAKGLGVERRGKVVPPRLDMDKIAKGLGAERKMNTRLDMDKIAKGLGAERRGKVVPPTGGYFGALQLLADWFVKQISRKTGM